jgi:hypothetical protein
MMDGSQVWFRFALAVLATWRITHLLTSEDGPGNLVTRLRLLVAESPLAGVMDCFGCLSLWVALPLAFFVSSRLLEFLLGWLAIGGAAFLLELKNTPPLVIERASDTTEGVTTDGLLRSETGGVEHPTDTGAAERGVDR